MADQKKKTLGKAKTGTAKKRTVERANGESVGLKVTKAKIESGKTPPIGGDQIGLEYVLPDDVPVLYVDNLNVLHTPSEFTLSLMQSRPPLLKSAAEWRNVKAIESRCVVRLIISPVKMPLFINVLMGNYNAFVESMRQEAGDGNDDTKTETDADISK